MSSAVQLDPIRTPDSEAARLYEAYAEQMIGYCTRRLRSRSEAEDAAQTTFLYALRALRRGVVPECESAWLHTIAKNVCNWQQRTASRRGPLATDVEVDLLAAAPEGEDAELLAGLREALASLPPQQQRALVMREWHGVPAREIAVELGLTAPQTHALLTRARHALAHALEAPGKAALGLGALVCGLRANVKALFAGVATKAAAVATVVVAGAGVTGAVADESDAKRAERERAIATRAVQEASAGVPGGVRSGAVDNRRPARPGADPAPSTAARAAGVPNGHTAAPGGAGAGEDQSAPAATGETQAQPASGVPPVTVDLPGELLPPVVLPPVEVPRVQVQVPKVELPRVELPRVEVPPVELPVEVPKVELPTVEVPPVELPAVQVPPLVDGEPPLVDVPATQVVVPPLRPLP